MRSVSSTHKKQIYVRSTLRNSTQLNAFTEKLCKKFVVNFFTCPHHLPLILRNFGNIPRPGLQNIPPCIICTIRLHSFCRITNLDKQNLRVPSNYFEHFCQQKTEVLKTPHFVLSYISNFLCCISNVIFILYIT